MIARLQGRLIDAREGLVVIDCHGVGYEVHVPASLLVQLPGEGHEATLWIRQIIREDDQSLYGFPSLESRKVFDLLREVKGCGARISIAILDTLGPDGAIAAIASSDAKALTKTSGVGPKLGERIILELKDKVGIIPGKVSSPVSAAAPPPDELVEALMALGYRRGEAEEAAGPAREESDDTAEQIKAALRRLKK